MKSTSLLLPGMKCTCCHQRLSPLSQYWTSPLPLKVIASAQTPFLLHHHFPLPPWSYLSAYKCAVISLILKIKVSLDTTISFSSCLLSLCPFIAKLLEKLDHSCNFHNFTNCSLLHAPQSCFSPKHSTHRVIVKVPTSLSFKGCYFKNAMDCMT